MSKHFKRTEILWSILEDPNKIISTFTIDESQESNKLITINIHKRMNTIDDEYMDTITKALGVEKYEVRHVDKHELPYKHKSWITIVIKNPKKIEELKKVLKRVLAVRPHRKEDTSTEHITTLSGLRITHLTLFLSALFQDSFKIKKLYKVINSKMLMLELEEINNC